MIRETSVSDRPEHSLQLPPVASCGHTKQSLLEVFVSKLQVNVATCAAS